MYASLMAADLDEELHLLRDGKTRSTTGSVVSSLYHLKDIDNSDAGFFVFPDLSVRTEGNYRLKLSLFEIIGKDVFHCKSIISEVFVVYSAKKYELILDIQENFFFLLMTFIDRFPGMEESTYLSRSFADQGLKIRIRKELRQRKKTGRRNESEDEAQGYTDTDPKIWKRTRKSDASGQDALSEDRMRSPIGFSEPHSSMPLKERQLGGPFNPIVGLNSIDPNPSPTISTVSLSTPTSQFFQGVNNTDSGFNSANPPSYGSTEIHPLRPHVPPSRLAAQPFAPPYSPLTSKKRQGTNEYSRGWSGDTGHTYTAGSTDNSQWHRTNMLNSYEPTYYPDSGADNGNTKVSGSNSTGDQESHLRHETDVSPYRSPRSGHQSRPLANGVSQPNRDTYSSQSLKQQQEERPAAQNYYHQYSNIISLPHGNHYSSYASNRQSALEPDGELEPHNNSSSNNSHRSLGKPGLRRPHTSRARGIHQIPPEHNSSQSTSDMHWAEDVKTTAMARLGS
ncbi:velvet factor-domain-containing protein [Phycomyces nitens]|nr:velvet factor-domain-containing protein [Phycomyces nitens]